MSKSQEVIKTKISHYLKATWYARWIIIGLVLASFLFLPNVNIKVVTALADLAIAYNIFLKLGDKAGLSLFSNRLFMEIADSCLTILLAVYSGGLSSPYLAILALMIVSSGYWFGATAAVLLGMAQLVTMVGLEWLQHNVGGLPKSFIVQMAVYITMGVYVSWLSQSTRSERSELLALSTEIEKKRQQLLALINTMKDAVLVIDPAGNIMIHNQTATALLGSEKLLQGQPIASAMALHDKDGAIVRLNPKHLPTLAEQKDLHLNATDGSLIHVEFSVAPYIVDRQNRGHVLIIQDITNEKTIDQEREEFIAVASHELRTPLTIAQGSISMMLSPTYLPDDPEAVGLLNSSLRSLRQLSNIINDLTNLSLADTKRLDVQLDSISPWALLKEFETDYRDQAKAKGLALMLAVDRKANLPTILTSNHMVREILTIFMANAIKFSDSGTITLSVTESTRRHDGVTFSVTDTGIGIAHSDQKKIFEKFFQSEHYMTRVHGGTGLGLFIARKLADRLTGDVWFETALGTGSTFYLWIPPYSQDKADQHKVASAETKDLFSTM